MARLTSWPPLAISPASRLEQGSPAMSRRCQITGKGVLTGNNVSHANNRSRRRFLPNLQETSLLSDVLGLPVRMRLSTRAIRTIEHNGGIDAYLLGTPTPPDGRRQGTQAPSAPRPGEADGQPGRLSHTVQQAIDLAAERLRRAGIDNPRLEARLLLAHAHGVTQETLLRDPRARADMASSRRAGHRRETREPLALILGRREFWGLEFAVSPATLIPRPELETLIEAAIAAFLHQLPPRLILDLGTGTGCLLLAALSEFPAAFGSGWTASSAAAALAARNATSLGLAERAGIVCGDWADALDGRFDLVLCNPPYVRSEDLGSLMPEVACHEPRSALDGGPDRLRGLAPPASGASATIGAGVRRGAGTRRGPG